MKLLSASEDLAVRTLGSVSGTLGKLLYLGGLRESTGCYRHWGLAQVHGEAESQTAIRDAHKSALKEVLRKPIRELWKEAVEMSLAKPGETGLGLQQVLSENANLLPEDCSRRSESHFNSVLQALTALEFSRKQDSSYPAA